LHLTAQLAVSLKQAFQEWATEQRAANGGAFGLDLLSRCTGLMPEQKASAIHRESQLLGGAGLGWLCHRWKGQHQTRSRAGRQECGNGTEKSERSVHGAQCEEMVNWALRALHRAGTIT
jgi:hypothetical protein